MIKSIWIRHGVGENEHIAFTVGEGGVEEIIDLPDVFYIQYKDRAFYISKNTARYWEVTFD